ncbi:hypothetical protein SYJ56_06700 [Algoriphagus sp. D3-2-R+10]|uniref:hypothetical protein n=1 Tax=Algoriphagus aurantiacus TaxID=3103948 RepID=UPI002B3CD224|nr:hypothetical protein [Algoriphagus sp. D3-2-R+10]MEB2774987.1 hypothetical protein [Algoriphagus sp. D3-2-R+10]
MKVGDQIQVEIAGGTQGVTLGDPGRSSMSIGPGASMSVPGEIIGDMGQYWQVRLSMSIDGRNIVNVSK